MSAVMPTEHGNPIVGPELQGSGKLGGFSPADLHSAYALPAEGGEGQTVAITVAYDNPKAEADLAIFRSNYGLPPCTTANGCFRKVNQRGEEKNYPAPNANWALEASLDLDMVSAACPKCHIVLVEADSNYFEDLGPAVEKAAELGVSAISNSWAAEEFSQETSLNEYFDHPGIPVLFATGDWEYGVYYPAASPDVVAVGGTSLMKASNKRGWTETAWSGAGSGCSSYEEKPQWQKDTGCGGRSVADVSAVSDPATPVSVYDSYGESGWTLVGGTSAATPIMAGVEALSTAGFRSAGPSAFTRVGNGEGLFDVVAGENGTCGAESDHGFEAVYLCQADIGYDGPTGWGSPNGPQALPVAITEGAAAVSAQKAVLHGSIDPRGLATEYRFEYGETTAYDHSVPIPDASAGSGKGYVEVSQAIEGLKGQTPYHYRIVATNAAGTFTGIDRVFGTTAPVALTNTANEIGILSATLRATINPQGLPASYYFEYGPTTSYKSKAPVRAQGVGSGTENVAVSTPIGDLAGGTTYHYRIVAKSVVGVVRGSDKTFTTKPAQWIGETLPQPPNSGNGHGALGVACTEANQCIAVGHNWSLAVHAQVTLAELWNGKSWSVMQTPNPPGLEEGWQYQRHALLADISCVSASDCVAVGNFKGPSEVVEPLVERWNGSKWSIVPAATPSGGAHGWLEGVSCTSSTQCTAVGYLEKGSGVIETLVERWNGSEWSIEPTPSPGGTRGSKLMGVSCPTATACTAVGFTGDSLHVQETLAERWNGTEWLVQTTPNPPDLDASNAFSDVSCSSPAVCTAVGHHEYRVGTRFLWSILAERWSSGQWLAQPTPSLPSELSALSDVMCVSSTSCTAVGSSSGVLGERWDGSSWSLLPMAGSGSLQSVFCTQAAHCTGVGLGEREVSPGWWTGTAIAQREVTPLLAGFSMSPETPGVGEPVTFDGSSSSASGGSITAYDWNFGDGSGGSGVKPSHTYVKAGEYTVTLTVTDNLGNSAKASRTIKVVNDPPAASFAVVTPSPAAGKPLEFDGSASSDSDGVITAHSWDFGDGSSGSGATPSHTYAHAGEYIVTLTVTDDEDATASVSHAIYVAGQGQLLVSKSGTGKGTVTGKPYAINCAASCTSAGASLYDGAKVTLVATPALGSTFTGWSGAGCSGTGTCEVTLEKTQSQSVVATFDGTAKAIVNPQALIFEKAAGTGAGTVKATGLACLAACVETEVAYSGGTTGSNPKPATLITLTATPKAGSAFASWSGCQAIEANVCKVTMSSARLVTAQFSALPLKPLTLVKAGTGIGNVASNLEAVNCPARCGASGASLYEGAKVTLTARPAVTLGSTFAGWEGCDEITAEGKCVVDMTSARKVTATFGGTAKAIVNPQTLTFGKAAGTGVGTVRATNFACLAACVGTEVAYSGGTTGSNPKPAALVTLTATPAPGSSLTAWVGCQVTEGNVCKVTMSASRLVTASFDE